MYNDNNFRGECMRHRYTKKNEPMKVQLKANETYRFCTCGKSDVQPLCDKYSHNGSNCAPLTFNVQRDGTYYLCGCKKSEHQPYCDGSHKKKE